MKKFCLDKLSNFITKYKDCTEEELEKLEFGLEGLYLTITKSTIILLSSFILGVLKETLIILVFFNILRFTGFGFHAGKSIHCLIFSIILFSILPYLFFNIQTPSYSKWIIITISFLSLLFYAPADTAKRPLPNKKKRIIRKWCTLITAFIYLVVIIVSNNNDLSKLLIISLVIEAIMVHPLTYKVFRQPYRNYRNHLVV